MTCQEAEPLLNARLDNELSAADSVAIDRHIAACGTCSAQYAALENLHREIVDAELSYAPAAGLRQRVLEGLPRKKPSMWLSISSMVAAAACVVVVVLSFSLLRAPRVAEDVDAALLDSHLRALQSNHLVDVPSSDKHTVKPWFQGKTSFSPPVPDLTAEGFELVGGRLEMVRQQPAAAIVYRLRQHVISLCVSMSAGGDAEPDVRDVSGYHSVRWARNGLSYWAVSDVDPVELRRFAELVRGR